MFHKRILFLLVLVLALSGAVLVYGQSDEATPEATPEVILDLDQPITFSEPTVIGYSAPNAGWPYIAAYIEALEREAEEIENLELVVLSAEGDIAKQATDMDTLIAQGVDMIFICSLDGDAVVPSIMAATDAGIPVLAVSNEPNEIGQEVIIGYSGPDDYVQGRIAAELMHNALGGEGNVVIIEGTPGQSTTALRNQGFTDELAELGSNLKIIAQQTANWDPVQAKAVTEDFLTAYGEDIDGLFSQDDNTAAAAAEVLHDAGRTDIIVVGTGGSRNGIQAIRDGLVYGTMNQSPSVDARQSLVLAAMYLSGEALPERRNIIPMPPITAENVDQFEGEW